MSRRLGFGLNLLVLASLVAPLSAADLGPAIDKLLAVGREGSGHRQAMEAWRDVAKAGGDDLPTLFAALDRANPLAANWLRSAIEIVAERELAQGRLARGELESYLLDRTHNQKGRRLAYEWLSRVDPQAPARLIPNMLQDPSLEMRRDAVALLLDEAKRRLDAADKTGAATLYEKALTGALDEDQVKTISDKLKELGTTVDLAQHYGYIMDWRVVGHFDNTEGVGFEKAYPPEAGVDLSASYESKSGPAQWKDAVSSAEYGEIDLNVLISKQPNVVAYAYAEVMMSEAREAELRYGTENASKVWCNEQPVFASAVYHAGMANDQYTAPVKLHVGKNTILLKVCQNDQKETWAHGLSFNLRVCDATGTAVLSTTRPPRVFPDPNAKKVEEE